MDRPVINEKFIERYEIHFGKGKATVNEYSPNLTKEDTELNRMTVKNILTEIFGKSRSVEL